MTGPEKLAVASTPLHYPIECPQFINPDAQLQKDVLFFQRSSLLLIAPWPMAGKNFRWPRNWRPTRH